MMAAPNKMPGMPLTDLLYGLVVLAEKPAVFINRLVLDSRQVQAGDLFIAVPGHSTDGRQFIDDAIGRGASAVLWQPVPGSVPITFAWREINQDRRVPVIAVENLKEVIGVLADRFYQEPSRYMYTVGITGTNGKTSCSQFIAQALAPEMKCGIIGTMGWGFSGNLHESNHTTPDAITCHQWLAEMKQAGARAIAMEVSSHALDQGRVNNVHFNCAVFTNLSHEHLDYHGDMQSYGTAKARLFDWDGVSQCVVNLDDEFGRQLAAKLKAKGKLVTYGLERAEVTPDLYADNIRYHNAGITADVHTTSGTARLNSCLYGRFNLQNLLATLGVLLHTGLDFQTAIKRLNTVNPVPGRMQVLRHTGQPVVIVDYAHTPDALAQALEALSRHGFGNIWCVFGCGGDRDRAKRPRMGEIATKWAKHIVLTNDNPRHENPEAILREIQAGIQNHASVVIEPDRARAIACAIAQASAVDVVLIAGKGHETWQQIGDDKIPFSDAQTVQAILAEGRP